MKEFSSGNTGSRSNQIGVKFVEWGIKTLWERSGTSNAAGNKDLRPTSIIHIDANVVPQDILKHLRQPLHDKLYFIYTGHIPMEHDEEMDIIDEMLDDSLKLYEYKPVMLAMGVATLLQRISRAELAELSEVLQNPNDKRAGQVIFSYDNIYKYCKDVIKSLGLVDDIPALFDSEDIDRTALIWFNKKQARFKIYQ